MADDGVEAEEVEEGAGVGVVEGVAVCAKTTVAEDRAKRAAAVTLSSLLVMGHILLPEGHSCSSRRPRHEIDVLLERWPSAYPSLGLPIYFRLGH